MCCPVGVPPCRGLSSVGTPVALRRVVVLGPLPERSGIRVRADRRVGSGDRNRVNPKSVKSSEPNHTKTGSFRYLNPKHHLHLS